MSATEKKITRASLTQLELILPQQNWKAGEGDKKNAHTEHVKIQSNGLNFSKTSKAKPNLRGPR